MGDTLQKPIVMYDSDEAAKQETLTGWVSRRGMFFGSGNNAEHIARYDGCTHVRCACGEIVEKSWTACQKCRDRKADERFADLPSKEWDGKTPLCLFRSDTYFCDEQELADYCEEHDTTPEQLQLMLCEPQYATEIDPNDHYHDLLPDDGEVTGELWAAFEELNQRIREYREPLCWMEGKYRAILSA